MRDDWARRLGPRSGTHRSDYSAHTAATVRIVRGRGTVTVTVDAPQGSAALEGNRVVYDLAVIAVGFGQESAPDGLVAPSYWTPDEDQLTGWRKSEGTVHVAGCGDGGIIDALRLVHGNFERGWLAIRLAQVLDRLWSAERRETIEKAEDDALLKTKSIRCMGIANPTVSGPAPADDYDVVLGELERFYEALAHELPDEPLELLDGSLDAAGVPTDKVELVAPSATLYTPYSAPIHKIMLAHAQRRRQICFRRGRLLVSGWSSEFVYEDGLSPARAAPAVPPVIRLGASSPLGKLIGTKKLESLRLRQFMLADFLDVDNAREPFAAAEEQGEAAPGYLASKLPFVTLLMEVVRPRCGAGFDAGGFTFSPAGVGQAGTFPPLELPDVLFGATLREEAVTEAPCL